MCSHPTGTSTMNDRVDFLRGHFDAARRAIAAGVDLRGYFVWSLMDNFEWAHGYTQFFGLVNVDYTPHNDAQSKIAGITCAMSLPPTR